MEEIKITDEWEIYSEKEKGICSVCHLPLNDGKHKYKWSKSKENIGISFKFINCPFNIGTIIGADNLTHECVFIPNSEREEIMLKQLRINFKERQEHLLNKKLDWEI
jgi:hypothetical protein